MKAAHLVRPDHLLRDQWMACCWGCDGPPLLLCCDYMTTIWHGLLACQEVGAVITLPYPRFPCHVLHFAQQQAMQQALGSWYPPLQ